MDVQPRRPWYADWNGTAPTAEQQQAQRAAAEQRFRALYPPVVWDGMTPVEQANARAAWDGQQATIAATRAAGQRTTQTLVVLLVVVPLVLAGLVALLVGISLS